MTSNNVKILIATHKPCNFPKDECFIPIHVGREIALETTKDGNISNKDLKWLLSNTIGDNTGDNISKKNRYYSEISAIYWAWKNYDKIGNPEYIGLMHYRRHFIFNNEYYLEKIIKECDYAKGLVYVHENCINKKYLNNLGLNVKTINKVLKNKDIIVSNLGDLNLAYGREENIKSDYVNNIPGMKVDDFELMVKIINKKYPQYKTDFHKYLNGKNKYLFQMFIMKKELFFEYCEFLFGVLFEIESQRNYENGYTINGKRTLGYLGEIMLTMFLLMKKDTKIQISNLGIAHINNPITEKEYKKVLIKNVIKNIFSIKNEAKHKVLCLFGIKFKIKNKFNELRTIVLEQQHQIHCLNNNLTEHQIQTFSFYNGDEYVKCNSLWEAFIRQIDENQFYRICTKYFSFRDLKDYHPQEVLMYVASCLNTNRIEKAQNMLSKYVDLFGLEEIWRFVQVAKFAHEQGLSDEKIEKAAFVFDKLEENRKNKVFEKLVEGKTVAVVGNGPSEIGKGKGSEIDSHDIVIRINNYQTEGFEQDYGSKTDIWVRGFGGEDLKDYTLNNNYLFAGITGDYLHIPLFWEFQLERIYRDLYSEILTAYISPDHYRRLLYEFEGDPTTGLSLIYTLLDLTPRKNVDFYGFSCFEDEFAGYATHYFNDRDENEARQRSSNHSFNEEAEYMRKLVRG